MRMPSLASPARRRPVRVIFSVLLAAALLAPLTFVFVQFWNARTFDRGFNLDERRGVRYLGPLTELISVLTEQQSATVRAAGPAGGDVQQAITAIDAVDQKLGGRLRTSQRWTELRQKVLDITDQRFSSPSLAFRRYSEVVDLAVALDRKVGDSSNLILDPTIDAYYVINTTLLRIPEVLVASGRYADLTFLTQSDNEGGKVETVARLAAARSQVLSAADDLTAGLEKSFEFTRSKTLGPALLRELDNFRTSIDRLAPRTSLLSPLAEDLDAREVGLSQHVLAQASMDLDRAALDQLDTLLNGRISTITRQLWLAVTALVVGVLVALAATQWLGVRPPRRVPPAPSRGTRHSSRRGPDQAESRELVGAGTRTASSARGGARAAR